MITTFETAKEGDRVWDIFHQEWFDITSVNLDSSLPIRVNYGSYTLDGRLNGNIARTIFWDEVIITDPSKPLPKLEVDTKVLVWITEGDEKTKRYFSHFDKNGNISVFLDGKTSWTITSTNKWNHWELAND